ncbi:non-canonical purine NTP pyrophosphatase [Candidatus Saccharibacteria bacterium]|nr:MAG: non-canonical purine NTP pyrophosphatase [Candidatus Saccharibacteria bacterium]
MTHLPVFITSNQHKADYLNRQLGLKVEHIPLELDEIQSVNLHLVVSHKLMQAYKIVGKPVIVEDVSLVFSALNGLPGPFIKWFIEHAGAEACCRMLDGFSDRSAVITCTYGYYDGSEIVYFDSEMKGMISKHPRGANGFGFDRIFVMDGDTRTRAELPQDEVEKTYADQMKPFKQVSDYLRS